MRANSTVTAESLDSRVTTLEPPAFVPVGENRVLRSWRSNSDLADDAEGSAESAGSSHDVKGKANRRIWMLEEELASARAATKTQAEDFEYKLEREKESASRLQGTIDHLQGKIAKTEQEKTALIEENQSWSEQVKLLQEQWGSQRERHSGQLEDLAGSVASLRFENSALNEQVTTLIEDKMALQEELRAIKARQDMAQSSRPALQVQSPNVKIAVRSPTPTTPTKLRLSTLDTLEAGKSLFSPGKSPTTSLARKFAHLEDRHAALREEYADLRSRYAADLKHWKEYRALEKARIEVKTQKKADKRKQREERKLATQSGSTARFVLDTSTAKVLVAASDNSQSLPRARESVPTPSVPLGEQGEQLSPVKEPDNKEYYSDEEEDRHRSTSVDAPSVSEARAGPQVEDTGRHSKPVSVTTEVEVTKTYSRSETGYDGAASPSTSTPATGRQRTNVTNARTTPWLGTPSKPSTPLGRTPSVGHSYRLGSLGEEVFDATPLPDAPASPSGKRTPLVRDRGAQPGSSLRRSTLKKLVGTEGQLETPIKGGDTGRKRKSVEMDNLTPAEKALELRKLNKLSAKEKKEYYAQYKGKGRYTAPEELESHVLEEYEIDPEKNEGANYQFHDVKRHKMDRKQMHGGDCECCKDYYEAVGPIPQYNQGPKWKDAPQPNDQGRAVAQAEVREHQNKVSRHRETWRRNPTPPGFWEIGFPATQTVEAQNAQADEMVAAREAQIRREVAHKDSKWRKKA